MQLIFIGIALLLILILLKVSKPTTTLSIPPNAYLVDVRTPKEFAAGSAPNAINIPLQDLGNSIHKFKEKDNIILFCRSGHRSGQGKQILEDNGISPVTNGGSLKKVLSALSN